MSTRNWTDAQRAAIEDRGGGLLVSAAAGSGKTAVLVERAVQLILDEANPIDADALLIVTFTRAAAEEMRARLAVRLAAEAAARPGNVRLRRQKLLLGRASICTIDSFCMELLQRYFAELGLPPDFGVADDAQLFALRREVMAEVLETMYEDADFRAFASLYGRARSDAGAAAAVQQVYDFLRALPHPAAALEEMCAAYEAGAPLVRTQWGAALMAQAAELVRAGKELICAARTAAQQEPLLAGYDGPLSADMAFFEALEGYVAAARWDDAVKYLAQYEPMRLPPVRGCESPEKETTQALRDQMKDLVAELREDVFVCTEAEFGEDCAQTAPLLRALARAVNLFETRFYEAKLAQKVLDYSDFEHLALRLLCDENDAKTPVARTVSARFAAVMVDEYQDTNALQALLYRCLAADDGSNLFFVGDVKQSIYRFRLVSPEEFLARRAANAPYAPGGPRPATVVLGHNFRSAGNVIGQVNDVFRALMSREAGGVDYTDEEKLVQGAPSAYNGGPLRLLLAAADEGGPTATDARLVADTIAEAVARKEQVRGENGAPRPCRPGDFCILLRSRTGFPAYAAALRAKGLPVFADTGDSWLASPEVSCVLSMLRAVDNPAQDVPLAAAMLSPMFRFTPDDLVALRTGEGKKRQLYASLLASEQPEARRFCALLGALRALAGMLPPEELCAELLRRTHFFAAVGAMENGAARRENLRSFLAFAASVSAGSGGGLSALLRRADDALEAGAGGGGHAPLIPADNVAVMTIHRSKGLEFPICILADTQRAFNLRDTTGNLLLHPVLGVGLRLRAETGGLFATAPYAAARLAIRRESVSEEMRILYVALTRARDRLIVTCALKNPEKTLANLAVPLAGTKGQSVPWLVARQRSFAAWLCLAALRHPGCDALRKAAVAPALSLLQAEGEFSAQLVQPAAPAQSDAPEQFVRTAQPDAALTETLRQNFSRVLLDAPLCALPAKLSVSAIVHGEAEQTLTRPAFLARDGMTAAEKGTALHAFLQFADFGAALADFEAEQARLVREQYLDPALAGRLDATGLRKFLASPLAERMRGAKKLLREYDFLTAVPAAHVAEVPGVIARQPVLVQGVADAVLVNDREAELVDYKTDRGATPEQLLERYSRQLWLYQLAIAKRLPVPITKCTIYSFALGCEIDVPLSVPLSATPAL